MRILEKSSSTREYIIALSRWRSRLALLASFITVSFSLYGVAGGMLIYAENGWPLAELFHFFTLNIGCLLAFTACLIIPYAVEGIRRKYFSYPRWVAMLHLGGTVSSAFVLVFSAGLMSRVDPAAAFGGYNFFLHIVCPIALLVSFFMVEGGYEYTRRDALAAVIPFLVYELIYIYEVALVGRENGGWEDIYHVTEYVPAGVSAPVLLLAAVGLSLLIVWLYNRSVRRRRRRLEARLWPKEVDPIEIRIEIFGLGRYMGAHSDSKFIELPLDLIEGIAELYGLSTEDLTRPYIRGFLDSLKQKGG